MQRYKELVRRSMAGRPWSEIYQHISMESSRRSGNSLAGTNESVHSLKVIGQKRLTLRYMVEIFYDSVTYDHISLKVLDKTNSMYHTQDLKNIF